MAQVVASQPYSLENSTQLTRPGSDAFYRIDGSTDPTIIDKHQAKRLYRLQRTPYVNTRLHLDSSDVGYETEGYFESTIRKQIEGTSVQPARSVYHRPTDMSDSSMARFSLGKSRPDPQRMIPREMMTMRNHPAAITKLRNGGVPLFSDRSVSDRTLRGRIGPGGNPCSLIDHPYESLCEAGSFNSDENCKQAKGYLRSEGHLFSPPNSSSNPRKLQRSMTNEFKIDELARHYMYTSVQQAASDEVPWDSKLPSILPVPLTTFEANGSDPLLKSKSLTSLNDIRSYDALEWDRAQLRSTHFYRKPVENVAPLPRAQQISGYSGCIGGDHIQDIDNPRIDFKPYTVVRTEQPKFAINPFKPNIPFYTGKTHWTKVDAVSHYDQSGRGYTTTAAFHKSLPIDNYSYRHSDLNGQLSRAVTTVFPQNPFNQIGVENPTTNSSLDTRSYALVQQLMSKSLTPLVNEETINTNEPNNN